MSICEYVTNVLKENNYLKSFLYDCLKRPTLTDCNPPEGDSAMKGFAIAPYIQGILGLQSILGCGGQCQPPTPAGFDIGFNNLHIPCVVPPTWPP